MDQVKGAADHGGDRGCGHGQPADAHHRAGPYNESGRLRYAGRTTTLGAAVRHALADQLRAGEDDHPWTGRTFHVGWGSRQQSSVHLVAPEVVAEVAVDVARDSAERWRHPVRLTRIRTDMGPGAVALFGTAG